MAILAVLMVGGCTPRLEPLSPSGLPLIDPAVVDAWVTALVPTSAVRYELRWMYETQQGRVRGRAAVRFAPPDSLRFDYRAPFGRSGAAVLIGDSVMWAEPDEEVETLIPVVSLFWAALALPYRPPRSGVAGEERANVRVWRFVHDGLVQTYVQTMQSPRQLQMELRRGDDVVGSTSAALDSLGMPTASTILFPRAAARFTLTVNEVERLASIDPMVWREP